jgi:radical SAM superfamily enzyme YgiQ (UPF0313 family)
MGYLASTLRAAGHEAKILDAQALGLTDREALDRALAHPQPALIGLSIPFQERLRRALIFASALRQRGYRGSLVAGGHPPTFLYQAMLVNCHALDAVALGESEETLLELASRLEDGREWRDVPGIALRLEGVVRRNPPRPMRRDLDSLPFPARDTLPVYLEKVAPGEIAAASVLRSRGCTAHCSFCDTRAFYRSMPGPAWRVRSASNVVNEIEELMDQHGVGFIRFWDDNFMGPGNPGLRAARSLATEILSRGLDVGFGLECRVDAMDEETLLLLKEAGLKRVFLGVESGVQRALDTYDKGVTVEDNRRALSILGKLGIDATLGFIMFDPYTTFEEVSANTEFLKSTIGPWPEVRRVVAQPMNVLQVYDGTPLADRLRQEDLLLDHGDPYPPFHRYRFLDSRVRVLVGIVDLIRRVGLPLRDALTSLSWNLRRRTKAAGALTGNAPVNPVSQYASPVSTIRKTPGSPRGTGREPGSAPPG